MGLKLNQPLRERAKCAFLHSCWLCTHPEYVRQIRFVLSVVFYTSPAISFSAIFSPALVSPFVSSGP